MVIKDCKVLFLNSKDLLPQFKNCDGSKVNLSRITTDCLVKSREADIIVFLDDRTDITHTDKTIVKMVVPEGFIK